jgi:hypothetical protein
VTNDAAEHADTQILTYASQTLPPHLRWQILSGLRCVWPKDYSEVDGPRSWIAGEEFHPSHVSVVRNGFVLAHTVVIWKTLAHAGARYLVYGLSMVFSFPDCQGRGLRP